MKIKIYAGDAETRAHTGRKFTEIHFCLDPVGGGGGNSGGIG